MMEWILLYWILIAHLNSLKLVQKNRGIHLLLLPSRPITWG